MSEYDFNVHVECYPLLARAISQLAVHVSPPGKHFPSLGQQAAVQTATHNLAWGGNNSHINVIMYFIWATQQTESFLYRWLCTLAFVGAFRHFKPPVDTLIMAQELTNMISRA